MKDSKEKEHRISKLKSMLDHIDDEEKTETAELEEDDLEEDEELINFLNEGHEEYEIDDEYIYRPGKNNPYAVNLEDDAEIDENFIIETNINEKLDEKAQVINQAEGLEENIGENFDNLVNIKIGEKPVLAIISIILGLIFIISSIFVYNSGSERIIDNVVSGENNFLVVVLIIIGILLLIYGVFKVLNLKSPFDNMINSVNTIEEEKETLNKVEDKKEEKIIPKSNIPLDKESYKIGEFDMDELKSNLKKSFSKNLNTKKEEPSKENVEEEINVEDLPPAREKSESQKGLIKEEIEEQDYEQAQLDGESIDEIFADVEELKDDEK